MHTPEATSTSPSNKWNVDVNKWQCHGTHRGRWRWNRRCMRFRRWPSRHWHRLPWFAPVNKWPSYWLAADDEMRKCYHFAVISGQGVLVTESRQPKLRVRMNGHGSLDASADRSQVIPDALSFQFGEGTSTAVSFTASGGRWSGSSESSGKVAVNVNTDARSGRSSVFAPQSVLPNETSSFNWTRLIEGLFTPK